MRSRARKHGADRPTVSLVVVWREDGRDLDRRLGAWLPPAARETVDLVLVRSCSSAERLKLERAFPGMRQVAAPAGEDLQALRQAGVALARGDIVVVLDDVIGAEPSWRDRLPFGLGGDAEAVIAADIASYASRADAGAAGAQSIRANAD